MMTTAEQVLARLEAFKLEKKGAGKYRCNSPLRPGSDSHAFSLKIEADGEHGAYQDFASDDKGSLYDLAQQLGIELPQRAQVVDTKRVYADLVDYARAHGVEAGIFVTAGWKQVMRENRPALQFPTQNGQRWRFIDGQKPAYKSEPGYKKCWYGALRAMEMESASKLMVICNGEASTIVAQHYGVPALCVTAGEAQIPNELIKELDSKLWVAPGDLELLIAMDCDTKGREAAHQVESQFKAMGFTSCRAVDLQLGDKGDLADFCMLHQGGALTALRTLPALAQIEPDDEDDEDGFQIYDIMDFDKIPSVNWIIPGEIPEQGFVMLFGESNVGKSFIAVDYALRIAENHRVLYVACEGESGIPLRVDGWLHHYKRQRADFKFKMMVGFISFFEKANLNRFIDFIKPHDPYVIIVDTLGLIMGAGDENSARDVNIIMRGSKRIQRCFGCTVIFIHHTNKGGVQERGSGALRGRMDTVIQVLPDDDLIRVESSKGRDQKGFAPKSIKLLPVIVPDKGETLVPVAADSVPRTEDVTPDQRKLLEVMGLSVYAVGISQRDLAEVARLPYGRTVRALANLANKGLIQKPHGGQSSNRISNEGRAAIGLPGVVELDRSGELDRSLDRSEEGESSRVDRVDRVDHPKLHNHPVAADETLTDPPDPPDPSDPHGENSGSLFNLDELTKKPNHYQKELQS